MEGRIHSPFTPISGAPPPPHPPSSAATSASTFPSNEDPARIRQEQPETMMRNNVNDLGEEVMLHSLTKIKDPVEDLGSSLHSPADDDEQTQRGEGQDKKQRRQQAIKIVDRPAPSLVSLAAAVLDRTTGLLSTLQFNMNRDAGSIDMTLLRASRRPRWSLHVDAGPSEASCMLVAQDRALILRHGPDFSSELQAQLSIPPEEYLHQPVCWTVAFSPPAPASWIAVSGWLSAIHIYHTASREDEGGSIKPALTLPSLPGLSKSTSKEEIDEASLVASLAWRASQDSSSNLELLILSFTGHFCRLRLHQQPGEPVTLKSGQAWSMDLRKWHRTCTAMAFGATSNRVVIAGGSLRKEHASVMTIWRCAGTGEGGGEGGGSKSSSRRNKGSPLLIEHQIAVGVGLPLLLKPHQVNSKSGRWLGQGLFATLDAKIPLQCPILSISLSPNGQLAATFDLEGGLSLFKVSDDAFGAIGGRITTLPIGGRQMAVDEVEWWSDSALAVMDKRGHTHLLGLKIDEEGKPVFKILLSKALGIQRASLACPGDDQRLFVLESHLGLNGCLQGWLTKIRRQTPMEAMLTCGQAGQVMEALEVAAWYGLDTDPMFKALWKNSRHTVQDIEQTLAPVKDTAWVLEQIVGERNEHLLVGVGDTALEAACKLGLERTNHLVVNASAAQAHLCLYRLKVLDLRDRVLTYRAIANAGGKIENWYTFRHRSIIEVAEDIASEGNVRALTQIIRNHPLSLGPADVARLLHLLPETLNPSSFQHLLPGMGGSDLINRRALDWVEEGRASSWQDFWTPEILKQWYVERAEEVEAKGGALAAVRELINVGLSRGVPEGGRLGSLRAEIWHLSRLVYGGISLDPSSDGAAFTLATWRALSVRLVMRRVIEQAPFHHLVDTIKTHIIPMVRGPMALQQIHGSTQQQQQDASFSSPLSPEIIMEEEITDMVASRLSEARAIRQITPPSDDDGINDESETILEAAVAVAQASRPILPENDRIIRRDPALFRLVLRCCRAHDTCTEPPGAIDMMWSLIECLPIASTGTAEPELQVQVDALESRLVAGQYLVNYGLFLPLSAYELYQSQPLPPLETWQLDFRSLSHWPPSGGDSSNGQLTRQRLDLRIVGTMANHLASLRGAEAVKASEGEFWGAVGEDVHALQAGVFAAIPLIPWAQALVYAALGRGQLRISEPLLAGLMAGLHLPAQALEGVVLQLLMDWIEDAEWGLDVEVSKALALVDALPFSSSPCTQEARFLECIQLAASLAGEEAEDHEGLTPIEIRSSIIGGHSMEVIAAILDARPTIVIIQEEERELMKLAMLMGLGSGRDPDRVRAQMAKSAVEQREWTIAARIIEGMQLASEGDWGISNIGWEVAWSVLAHGNIDPEAHRQLLCRALSSCSPTDLPRFTRLATEAWMARPGVNGSIHEATLRSIALEDYRRCVRQLHEGEDGGGGGFVPIVSPEQEAQISNRRDEALLGLTQEALDRLRGLLLQGDEDDGEAAEKLVEMTLVYLMGLQDIRRGVELIRDKVSDAEHRAQEEAAEMGKRSQEEGARGDKDGVDEGMVIVRQLVARGYSKNGAIKAARAVGNKSSDKALQWAISHCHDPCFDDPPTPSSSSALGGTFSPPKALPSPARISALARSNPDVSSKSSSPEKGARGEKEEGPESRLLGLIMKLAIRYLSLEALASLPESEVLMEGGGGNTNTLTALYQAPAEELLKLAMALPEKSEEEDGSPAALCRREVARYSQEAGLSGVVTTLQAFVPWNLDAARLRVDEAYRLEAAHAAAQRDDSAAWKATCAAAEAWTLDPWELAMTHVEYWYLGPLKEAWERYKVAGATEAIGRYETIALGRSREARPPTDPTTTTAAGEAPSTEGLPSTTSSLSGCNPGSPGALLLTRPRQSLDRLISLWGAVDGATLPLLEPLGRLMADVATACERLEGPNPEVASAARKLRDHVQLLRRLVRVPGLVPLLNYKTLTGSHPFQWDSAPESFQQAYKELGRVVRRDNVGPLTKLAPRIPPGGLTASTINRAYAEALLRGYDPLLAEEEANLPLARADARERFAHRIFVAEPYLERLASLDLVALVEGLCLPQRQTAGAVAMACTIEEVPPPLSSVADRLAFVSKAQMIQRQGSGDSQQQQQLNGAYTIIQCAAALAQAMTIVGSHEGPEAAKAIEAAWIHRSDVGPLLEEMVIEGKMTERGGLNELIDALIASDGPIVPQGGSAGIIAGAVRSLLRPPVSKTALQHVDTILKSTAGPDVVGGDEVWSLLTPVLEVFLGENEEGEGSIDDDEGAYTARADLLEMVVGIGRRLSGAGGEGAVEALVGFNRAAEIMMKGLGRRLLKGEVVTDEGKVRGLLEAIEGPRVGQREGIEAAVTLLRLWGEGKGHGKGSLGLDVRWSRWVIDAAAGSDQQYQEHEGYASVGRRLVERALEHGLWEEVTALLVWGPWRACGHEEGEEALLARLDAVDAPMETKIKVALSSSLETVRQRGLDLVHQAVEGEENVMLPAATFAADDTLLGLTMASLLPSGVDPWPLIKSWTWKVMVEALLLRSSQMKSSSSPSPPTPFPASVSFVAARLVAGQAHLQAAALIAESKGLHQSLRTAEGALSLLWTAINSTASPGAAVEEGLWDLVREPAREILEQDEAA